MSIPRSRGCLSVNDHAFFAIGDAVYNVTSDGSTVASYGPIKDDLTPPFDRVQMAIGGPRIDDGNPSQLVFTSGQKAYMLPPLQEIPWLVGTPVIGCAVLNNYFLFLSAAGDGFFFSEPGDALSGSLLNFISAEADANYYWGINVLDQRIWLNGQRISQVFYDNSSIDPTNPFLPDQAGVIQQGTAALNSPTVFDNALHWVSRNEGGQGIAFQNNGYLPVRISNFAVEDAWRKYPTIEDAVGYTVTQKGHQWWRIWFPSGNETWQYDPLLGPALGWSKALYLNPTSGRYEADRGACACELRGQMLVGDRANSKIYKMSLDYLDDAGDRIAWMRRAPIISNENKMISYPWFELDCQVGVGDGSNLDPNVGPVTPEADPMVMMRYSNDWGQTWSNERLRSMGKQGEYGKRVIWTRNGQGRQRVFEVSGSASVKVAISSAYLRDPLARTT